MEVSIRNDALEIRRDSRDWRIPVSRLPARADDCHDPRDPIRGLTFHPGARV
jgi:hypothetical protein